MAGLDRSWQVLVLANTKSPLLVFSLVRAALRLVEKTDVFTHVGWRAGISLPESGDDEARARR